MATNRQVLITSLENQLWLLRYDPQSAHFHRDNLDSWQSITINEIVEDTCKRFGIFDWYMGLTDKQYKLMVMKAIRQSRMGA